MVTKYLYASGTVSGTRYTQDKTASPALWLLYSSQGRETKNQWKIAKMLKMINSLLENRAGSAGAGHFYPQVCSQPSQHSTGNQMVVLPPVDKEWPQHPPPRVEQSRATPSRQLLGSAGSLQPCSLHLSQCGSCLGGGCGYHGVSLVGRKGLVNS